MGVMADAFPSWCAATTTLLQDVMVFACGAATSLVVTALAVATTHEWRRSKP